LPIQPLLVWERFFAGQNVEAQVTNLRRLHHIRIRLFLALLEAVQGLMDFIIISALSGGNDFDLTITTATSLPLVNSQASSWTWLGTLNDNVLTPTFSPPDSEAHNNVMRFFPWGSGHQCHYGQCPILYTQVAVSYFCPQWLWRLLIIWTINT